MTVDDAKQSQVFEPCLRRLGRNFSFVPDVRCSVEVVPEPPKDVQQFRPYGRNRVHADAPDDSVHVIIDSPDASRHGNADRQLFELLPDTGADFRLSNEFNNAPPVP